MFAQKPPNIKKAIFNFLRGVDIIREEEIVKKLAHLSTAKKYSTKERIFNRTLNELFAKGKLQKLKFKDNTFITWDNLTIQERNQKFARFYKLVSEQYKKMIGTSMYIGTNQTGNQDSNPNYDPDSNRYRGADKSPRKTPTDLKAWLFDNIENRDIDRFDVLSEFLYLEMQKSKLTYDTLDGVFTQFDVAGIYAGTNNSKTKNTITLADFRMLLGRDMVMPMQNVEDYKIFNPKTKKPMFWKYRNVEQ